MEKKIQINNYFFITLIIFNFISSQEKWNYSAEEMDQTKINDYSIRRLKENVRFVKTDQIMLTDNAVQYIKDDISITSYVDFYFYINNSKNNYIIEKHNFLSNFKDPKFAIHFPKKFIFPIKKDKYYKIVSLPKKPEMLCQFLYGVEWKTPLKKNISYRMEIVDNKPLLIKRSFLGSITRWFKTKLSIN